jgi:hypothetical protein
MIALWCLCRLVDIGMRLHVLRLVIFLRAYSLGGVGWEPLLTQHFILIALKMVRGLLVIFMVATKLWLGKRAVLT